MNWLMRELVKGKRTHQRSRRAFLRMIDGRYRLPTFDRSGKGG